MRRLQSRDKFFLGIMMLAFCSVFALPLWAADMAKAKADFQQHCAKCHGDSGKGDGATAKKFQMKMTDYSNKEAMAKLTDDYLVEMITKGGKALNKSPKMQAYGTKLSEAQIKDLAAYIRSFSK